MRLLRVIWRYRILLVVVRPINTNLAAHDFVIVKVAHRRGSGIGIRKVCESITLGLASLGVHHQSELGNGTGRAEDIFDLFLGEV